MTIYNKIGTGPNWDEANQRLQSDCQAYWWSSLLYIQNFVNPEKNVSFNYLINFKITMKQFFYDIHSILKFSF